MTLRFEIETSQFIQVLHDGDGHWLTISNIGARNVIDVFVFNSMYPSIRTYTKKQVAAIMFPTKEKFTSHDGCVVIRGSV